MAIVGAFIFGLYALLALGLYAADIVHPAVIVVGILSVIAGQYFLGVRAAVRGLDIVELPEDEFPEIHRRTHNLSERMEIAPPKLFIGDFGGPNAFAVGRRGSGVVVLSKSLLEVLDLDEVQGVVAHELAHLKNRDSVLMGIGYTIASIIG